MRTWNGRGGNRRAGRLTGSTWLVLIGLVSACDVPTEAPQLESTFLVTTEQLSVPVAGAPVTVVLTHDMAGARNLVTRTRGGSLIVDIENGSAATGRITLRVSNGQVDIMAFIDSRGQNERIPLTRSEVQSLLGSVVTLRASGTLCPASGCATAAGGGGGHVVKVRSSFELQLDADG